MGMFARATKRRAKLRAAVFGPSGAGKTYTSLRVAAGLGGKVAVIDTERSSASKYADRFDFDAADLADRSIDGYCRAIAEAARAGYEVLVIDGLSHGWQELIQQVEKVARAKYKGNTWSAWSEGTPQQRRLVDAILDYPGHVIATMRSKTEWQTESDGGKSRPVRVGLAPEQGKGIEYEFDLLLELSVEHQAHIIKDRTGRFQDKILDRPGEDFGRELAAWLGEGQAAATAPPETAEAATDGPTEVLVGPAADPDEWPGLLARTVRAAQDEWDAELKVEQVVPERRKPLTDQDRATNALVTLALGAGKLQMGWICKRGKPEVRDPARCKVALRWLYGREPEWLEDALAGYLRDRRRDLRAELGMFDPDAPEGQSQEPPFDPAEESQAPADDLETTEAGARG